MMTFQIDRVLVPRSGAAVCVVIVDSVRSVAGCPECSFEWCPKAANVSHSSTLPEGCPRTANPRPSESSRQRRAPRTQGPFHKGDKCQVAVTSVEAGTLNASWRFALPRSSTRCSSSPRVAPRWGHAEVSLSRVGAGRTLRPRIDRGPLQPADRRDQHLVCRADPHRLPVAGGDDQWMPVGVMRAWRPVCGCPPSLDRDFLNLISDHRDAFELGCGTVYPDASRTDAMTIQHRRLVGIRVTRRPCLAVHDARQPDASTPEVT
jgi:hypothetical protein